MSLIYKVAKYAGILAAESAWVIENGIKAGVLYYSGTYSVVASETCIKKISELAVKHSIDSNDSEIVTENIFNCLEYID